MPRGASLSDSDVHFCSLAPHENFPKTAEKFARKRNNKIWPICKHTERKCTIFSYIFFRTKRKVYREFIIFPFLFLEQKEKYTKNFQFFRFISTKKWYWHIHKEFTIFLFISHLQQQFFFHFLKILYKFLKLNSRKIKKIGNFSTWTSSYRDIPWAVSRRLRKRVPAPVSPHALRGAPRPLPHADHPWLHRPQQRP